MTYRVAPTEGRADWLAKRRTGIGSSDIAGIMGLSPYTTPFQVWASKVYDLPDDTDDEAMRWGTILENVILDEWGKQNWEVVDRGLLLRSTVRPHYLATPDGLTDNGTVGALVEAKNTSDWSWSEVPAHYRLQVQWQLMVTGEPLAYLVALHGGRRMVTYEIEPEPDLHAEMAAAADEMWELVETDEPPAIGADDSSVMASLWPTSDERATEIALEATQELYEARSARDAGKRRYEAATAVVKEAMRDADTAVYGQAVVATWKGEPRRFIVKGEWE